MDKDILAMEKLMQYIWQHRLYKAADMSTVDGRRVRVIDPGRLNTDSGPDFFNAKVEIDRQMWVGDVEIHVRASDWHRHGHDKDPAYDSVILHVVGKDDTAIQRRSDGEVIPQLRMPCAPDFQTSYMSLVNAAACPALPCADDIASMGSLHMRGWLDSLAYERLYAKSDRIDSLLERLAGDWEAVCFVVTARALGFGINSEPFERLALSVPLSVLRKHSDSIMAMEAILFGQAGFLPGADVDDTQIDPYVSMMKREYAYLANKFSLAPPRSLGWKMARMRPANFPQRRLAFLAALLFGGFRLMARIASVRTPEDAQALFRVELSPFWRNHYSLTTAATDDSDMANNVLSRSSVDLLTINAIVPLQYAYGQHLGDNAMMESAIDLLQHLPPENNSVTRMFASCGIECPDAFTSQALIELRREYCEVSKCLYCRIGHLHLSRRALRDN